MFILALFVPFLECIWPERSVQMLLVDYSAMATMMM